MQSTALGQIFVSSDVADLAPTRNRFRIGKTGITLGNSNVKLSGTVKEFKMDDLGYSVDWTYIINYTLTDKRTAATLLE